MIGVKYHSMHAHQGKLIVQHESAPNAPVLTCTKVRCFVRFVRDSIRYGLLRLYEEKRISFAESKVKKIKDENGHVIRKEIEPIPMHYRTGESPPTSILGALWRLYKITEARF